METMMTTIVNHLPLSPVAQVLAASRGKREADALRTWRQSVKAVAESRELTTKQVEALSAAQFDLGYSAEKFDADVGVWRAYLTWKVRRAELPTPAEQAEKVADIRGQAARLTAEIDKLKAELRQVEFQYQTLPQSWMLVESQFQLAEKDAAGLLEGE